MEFTMIKITPFLAALTIMLAGCDNNASNTMQHDAMSSQDSMTQSPMSDGSMAKDSRAKDSMSRDEMPYDRAKSDMDHDAMTK
jgi:pentapeptide MXKDX repeat protein